MQLKYICNSLLLNYKSWIIFFLALYLIDCYKIYDFITIFIMLLSVHLVHHFSHYSICYPFNCTHLYHHNNNNFLSHFIQIIIEFVCILSPIIIKNLFCTNSKFFNSYLIIFVYIFYTTVHNINYSIFHVNNIHEYHHLDPLKNAGPDICDILFNSILKTKYNIQENIENTDHYIPNIGLAVIIIIIIKYINKYINNKDLIFKVFFSIMIILSLFLILSSIIIFINDVNKYLDKKIKEFA